LALVMVSVIFVPGTGYLGYLQALQVAEKQMEQYTIRTSSQVSKRVNSFLTQHQNDVTLLASLLGKDLIDPSDTRELLEYFNLFKKDHPEFVNIYYGDESGRFTMVPPQRPEVNKTFDPRNRSWYRGATKDGKYHWTDVYLLASSQKLGITVSAPIHNRQGKLRGVCGIDIDLITFSKFLQAIELDETGVAYIFENSTGEMIAHPWLLEPHVEKERLELLSSSWKQLSSKQQQFGRTIYNKRQYFSAYSEYPGKDWTVGVTLSTDEYLEKIQVIKQTTLSLVLAAILLSLILSYLLSANIMRPLLELKRGIDRIGSGNLEYRMEIKDPDIARDLARSFNKMAFSLRQSLVELKSTYHELQEKQKLAAVGKMTAGIAHEIKNPLGIILGSAQVVLDKQRPWEMREKAASFILDEVVRLDTTLKSFLAFARPSTPVFSEVDVADLLDEMLSATEERYNTDGYRIKRDYGKNLPLIEADPAQMRQIFMNLILNSFKAMADGGLVTIRVRTEKEPQFKGAKPRFISIRNPFTVDRDWLIVSIRDEGCGISEEQIEKIMDPFVSYRDDGIGLGLSIVSQLVKLHRGHVEIESSESHGATFHLYFPCILKESYTDVEPAAS